MAALPPPTLGRTLVRLTSTNGRVAIVAEARSDVEVTGRAGVETRLEQSGSVTTVIGGNDKLTLRVPIGTDLVVGTTTGRIEIDGVVGRAAVTTESGRVSIAQAESVDVRSETGKIEIGHAEGRCCLRSVNGRVAVAACGDADVATASGKIVLRNVRGTARAHCANGRIDIEMATANDVAAETVTGRIAVALPRGVRPFHARLTDPPTTRPADTDCTVSTHTVTGRVDITTV